MMQVLAVFLVVATICIFAVGKWSENQIKEKNDQLFGRWNEVFLNVDEEDVEYFRRHAFVDDYSVKNIPGEDLSRRRRPHHYRNLR